MPTYEYKCEECGHQFEVFARMSDPDPEDCEACGAKGSLVKVLFPVAVHYKGSGFYSTDYSGKGGAGGSGAGTPSGGSSDGASTDSAGSSSDSSSSSGGDSSGASTGSSGSGSGSAPAKPASTSES